MIWITILFGVLNLLLTWLLNRKKSGPGLTGTEKRRLNHAYYLMEQCRPLMDEMGCKPQEDTQQTARAKDLQ